MLISMASYVNGVQEKMETCLILNPRKSSFMQQQIIPSDYTTTA